MRALALSVFCLLAGQCALAQWSNGAEINLAGMDKYDQDQMGNIYIATKSGDVKKYSPEGKMMAEYSAALTGSIHRVDATSQLRVLVFYEDLQEYVLLDRYLRSPSRYELRDFGLGFVSDMTMNAQQNIWVVDQSDFTLKLLDPRRNLLMEKVSLARILDQKNSDILSLVIHQNQMFLIDKNAGILIFDSIGNYVDRIHLINNGAFWFFQDFIYYIFEDKVYLKNIHDANIQEFILPDKGITKILFDGDRLVNFTDQGFVIYRYLSTK